MYACLPSALKSVATEYVVRCILKRYGVDTIAQFQSTLEAMGENLFTLELEMKSNFWYKKKRGEPVLQHSKIERVVQLYPESIAILDHPFFLSLACGNVSNCKITNEVTVMLNFLDDARDDHIALLYWRREKTAFEMFCDVFASDAATLNDCEALFQCYFTLRSVEVKALCRFLIRKNLSLLFDKQYLNTCEKALDRVLS